MLRRKHTLSFLLIITLALICLWQFTNAPIGGLEGQGAVSYNCKISGGSFVNDRCECPVEEELGQTSDMMYDEKTGYCQNTEGDLGIASLGLPDGDYAFWTDIVAHNCSATNGKWLNARCTCPDPMSYNKDTGYCQE